MASCYGARYSGAATELKRQFQWKSFYKDTGLKWKDAVRKIEVLCWKRASGLSLLLRNHSSAACRCISQPAHHFLIGCRGLPSARQNVMTRFSTAQNRPVFSIPIVRARARGVVCVARAVARSCSGPWLRRMPRRARSRWSRATRPSSTRLWEATSAAECRKLALDGDRHLPKRRLRTLWRSLAVAALLHL